VDRKKLKHIGTGRQYKGGDFVHAQIFHIHIDLDVEWNPVLSSIVIFLSRIDVINTNKNIAPPPECRRWITSKRGLPSWRRGFVELAVAVTLFCSNWPRRVDVGISSACGLLRIKKEKKKKIMHNSQGALSNLIELYSSFVKNTRNSQTDSFTQRAVRVRSETVTWRDHNKPSRGEPCLPRLLLWPCRVGFALLTDKGTFRGVKLKKKNSYRIWKNT